MLMVRLWGSLRVKTKTGRREDENWTAPSSLLQDSMFLSQELIDRRVIAAGMVWRSIGAAMITLMAGSMENNVPTTRADVMRPDSTAYAPPTIMFSASA